jgi:nicotinate-nucleotide adenylyltransferase
MGNQNKQADNAVPRIGIYAGTFDPIHAGHVAFALQAIEEANLDEVVIMPERRPRFKDGPEHYGHRIAMAKRAIKPHKKLSVLETADKRFSVKRTLPQLRNTFADADLVLLVGSDVAEHIPDWYDVERLLKTCELVVGVRGGQSPKAVRGLIEGWQQQPKNLHVFQSYEAAVSSGSVRAALRAGNYTKGLLQSVHRYARHNWLYVSVR